MRSLTTKLVLAFLLTSVASVALASLFIRQFVTREFDDYVIAQQRSSFLGEIGGYYQSTGSWAGIEDWLRSQALHQLATTPAAPGAQRRSPPRLRFVLADAAGVVVLPFGPYALGERVGRDEIARGTPVIIDRQVVGTIITPDFANFRNPAEERYLDRTNIALGIAAAVMVGIALAVGVLLARVITGPVRELTTAAQKIAGGNLEQRVPVRSRDELGLLATQFNQMSADLAHATHLRRQMTADVAHDLRTPLTVIAGYLEALRDQVLKPTPERFATMYDETQLLLHLVDDLHTLSLADAGELPIERRPIAPQLLLERVAEAYRHSAEQQGVALRVCAEGDAPEICVDGEQMARVLGNLVSNALRYTEAGGTIALSACGDYRPPTTDHRPPTADHRLLPNGDEDQLSVVRRPSSVVLDNHRPPTTDHRPLPKGDEKQQLVVGGPSSVVVFEVADTGAGIAAEHLPNIFERFYRADPSRQQATGGSGLGLAIVKSIVEAHGGRVGVASQPGEGTAFTITLPLSR